MIVVLALLFVLGALGVAVGLGFTPDTRDPAFGMGRLAARHSHR